MVTTIVPCKKCHRHPCVCTYFVDPNYTITCKCGAELKICSTWYKDWGETKSFEVEQHECIEENYDHEGE